MSICKLGWWSFFSIFLLLLMSPIWGSRATQGRRSLNKFVIWIGRRGGNTLNLWGYMRNITVNLRHEEVKTLMVEKKHHCGSRFKSQSPKVRAGWTKECSSSESCPGNSNRLASGWWRFIFGKMIVGKITHHPQGRVDAFENSKWRLSSSRPFIAVMPYFFRLIWFL